MRGKSFLSFAVAVSIVLVGCAEKSETQRAERTQGVIAGNGMVVSANKYASDVGVEIMKRGGNAFDAAVAVQFALAVVYPRAGNIGGGGFAVYRDATGVKGALDFREKAPSRAEKNMYLDEAGEPVKDLSLKGVLSVGVPGTVNGMVKLHERFGELSWKELVAPSIQLAKEGVVISENQALRFNQAKSDFEAYNRFSIPMVKDTQWKRGDLLILPELAVTLERIAEEGNEGFYEGITAELIVAEMEARKGLISLADLKAYEAVWRNPIIGEYRGYNIISMPPPSSGGVAIVQLFNGLKGYDISLFEPNSVEAIHLFTELERRVYADRAENLGDPDFFPVPLEDLLAEQRMKKRMESFDPAKKTPSDEIKAGNVEIIESVETTHFSIVDKEGNAVSITTTLNGYFGAKVMVKGAGFFLNNEMDDFSKKPGTPNQFGLVGGEANAIAPNKRMLSSMTPTIVEKNGKLWMVLGSPGGSTIITSVFQTMVNAMVYTMNMQEAVNAYRFHHQWMPDVIIYEKGGLDSLTKMQLEAKGQTLQERGLLGKVNAILVTPEGELEGAPDHMRGDEFASGY
ncbi:gamma-glutamyltransferase [Algoriphagus sp. Y33]|uniref:gamma-glutamyltransferase n=1 Tax=Algoriphagus sp. Y33 TaxID=2772483 RepID=UPI001CE22256|nr:gamma-glutamyltransferase [Algoriphagus sp. Y33]